MTATNPHPLANPLNRQRYAAFERCQPKQCITYVSDPSKLEVPQSSMTYEQVMEQQRSLTVPYSAPDDIGAVGSMHHFGFLGNSSLFMLQDGSVLDLKTHKVVLDPNIKFKAAGYWNDPNAVTSKQYDFSWGKTETIESLLAGYDASNGNYDPNLSPESVKYWNRAKEESKKLVQNMTDEQKELMKELDNEQFFPMTKLVEEK